MSSDIQAVQTAYRRKLLSTWPSMASKRVLELGCGQGDTTAVLAEAVGQDGLVVAVDPASPDYGAPMTLGQATQLIAASDVGSQVDFRLGFDLLSRASELQQEFDIVIFSHCSWYFSSSELLANTLSAVRPLAKRLCFAEWDLEVGSPDQIPHLLAVTIQGKIEAFKPESEANVRTPLSRNAERELIEEAGWAIEAETLLNTPDLQDADWEIGMCLAACESEADYLPVRLRDLVNSQATALRSIAKLKGNTPLGTYSLVAV